MTTQADVIVIGSGGLGAATAFHLAKHGVKHVVLVDKHDIGSQTSPRAAGMVSSIFAVGRKQPINKYRIRKGRANGDDWYASCG